MTYQREMFQAMKTLSKFREETVTEANDYKRTRQYNKLTPKLKQAVDMVFKAADKDSNGSLDKYEFLEMRLGPPRREGPPSKEGARDR